MDLSIVIPVYNTCRTDLERCFDSLKALQGICWEALVIDDGSRTETGDFCRKYFEDNPGFCYFYKENGGVSTARNLGLQKARGKYVMFVDGDDQLLPGAILPEHCGGNTDLVIYDMELCQKGQTQLWYSLDQQEETADRELLLHRLLTAKSLNSPCVKLFRMEIIREKGLRFDPSFVTGEDWMFVCDFVLAAQTARYIRKPCYRYFREESSTQSRVVKFPDRIIQNHISRFRRRKQVAAAENWKNFPQQQILSQAAAELIEDLFNAQAELLLAKKLTGERKNLLRGAVKDAAALLQSTASRKTKMKKWVMTDFPAALWVLASLRMLYLRIKK